jgi:hypothetical protein
VIKSWKIGWPRHVAHVEEMRNAHDILVGEHEGKRPVGIPRRRWEIILEWIIGN